MTTQTSAAGAADPLAGANRDTARTVTTYYDQCANDYRILWRTDENGTIHFGYFDEERAAWPARLLNAALSAGHHVQGIAAASIGLSRVLVGRRPDEERAVTWLRVAARGRASRHDQAQHRMTDVCAEAVSLKSGDRVLDAGCGVAGPAIRLAARYGVSVLGLNLQPRQLSEARRRVTMGTPRLPVRFSRQDYTEAGVASASVDVVWGLESICHCRDKSRFLREAHRVLRPGGRVMVADFFRRDETLSPQAEHQLRAWTRGWAIPNLASVAGFHHALDAAGFTNVRYRDISRQVVPSSRRLYKASLVAIPVDGMLRALGLRTGVQGQNVQAAFWQYRSLRAGAWAYGIFVAEK